MITHFYPTYFCHFIYRAFLVIVVFILIKDPLFILSNGKRAFFYIITSACYNSSIAALPAIGMWPKFWRTRHSLCTSRPRWVTIGPVLTLLSRTLGPSTTLGNLAQHLKKAHHKHKGSLWKQSQTLKIKVYFNQFLIFEYDQDFPIFPNSKFWPKKKKNSHLSLILVFLARAPKSKAIWQWSA